MIRKTGRMMLARMFRIMIMSTTHAGRVAQAFNERIYTGEGQSRG
jgi:hypothetical protein